MHGGRLGRGASSRLRLKWNKNDENPKIRLNTILKEWLDKG
jgi:hypothetical protein